MRMILFNCNTDKMTLLVILLIGLCGTNVFASSHKDPHFSRGHDTIVHLFEWKWSDIAQECESFLGPKGFGGIQVIIIIFYLNPNNKKKKNTSFSFIMF